MMIRQIVRTMSLLAGASCLALCFGVSSFAQFYPDEVMSDNPVAYWRFERDLTDSAGDIDLDPSVSPDFVSGPGSGTQAFSTNGGQAWAASFGAIELFDLISYTYEMWININGSNEGGTYVFNASFRRAGGKRSKFFGV